MVKEHSRYEKIVLAITLVVVAGIGIYLSAEENDFVSQGLTIAGAPNPHPPKTTGHPGFPTRKKCYFDTTTKKMTCTGGAEYGCWDIFSVVTNDADFHAGNIVTCHEDLHCAAAKSLADTEARSFCRQLDIPCIIFSETGTVQEPECSWFDPSEEWYTGCIVSLYGRCV